MNSRPEAWRQEFIPRPVLAFRVGITGARRIDQAAVPALRLALASVLAKVKAEVTAAWEAYAPAFYAEAVPRLRLLSPLAVGTDRLTASEALTLGYEIEVPLPFAQSEYEKDFADNVEEFRCLLSRAASVLTFDGARGEVENRSYEAGGRHVARNCDLLITVWDGGAGRGRGGTAEIVDYHIQQGHAVWWLPTNGGEPGWIDSPMNLQRLEECPHGEAAWVALTAHLRATMQPPAGPSLENLLAETAFCRSHIWNRYPFAGGLATGKAHRIAPSATSLPAAKAWAYWEDFLSPIDRLAIRYANRYRSAFMPAGANAKQRWNQHALSYRLLAEMFRKEQGLAMFGWSLPVASPGPVDRVDRIESDKWIGWWFNAARRAAPLPEGELRGANLKAILQNVKTSLLARQQADKQAGLVEAEAALQAVDLDAPLASEDAGAAILSLAETMLDDIPGWARLTKVKTI
jgi:hypothetical protein